MEGRDVMGWMILGSIVATVATWLGVFAGIGFLIGWALNG